MRKTLIMTLLLTFALGIAGCGAANDSTSSDVGVLDSASSLIPGTWQTASIGYVDGDDMQPEYYVQFTDKEINYGHMKDGEFLMDHADNISMVEEMEAGGYKVQAESSGGVKYTYQSAEGETDVLEYYETWDEAEFSEMYRAGASLSKCE